MVDQANFSTINDILNSWKGPYDKGHDFEMNTVDIEVKTKDISQHEVNISSEFQLESNFDKNLELCVISVERNLHFGFSLKDLIFEIKKLITDFLGDSSILLKAISQKGLSLKNLEQYDIYRFKPVNVISYNCLNDNFPKLIKSNIPKEINSISYNIRLSTLNEFIIDKKDF